MRPLSTQSRVQRSIDGTAAGTSDVNGASFDMAANNGYDSVMFVAAVGVLTATQVTQMHAESSPDDSTFTDIVGSQTDAMADDDDDQLIVLEVIRPDERYIRPVLERGTANAVIDGVIAIGFNAKHEPTTHDATTVQTSKVVLDGVAGTL